MSLDLSGHRAVVSGASLGIGAETVRVLAAHGADVAFCARNRDAVESLVRALDGVPGAVRGYVADMADAEAIAGFCDAAEADMGPPDILVNNRAGGGCGDFDTPEQRVGPFQMDRPWESCMTTSAHNHWAWGGPEDGVKPLSACLEMLIRSAGGDGNLLLNVGPMPTGQIDPAQANLLRQMGQWLAKYGESIYGTRGGPYKPARHLASTRQGNTVYLHILAWPEETLKLPALPANIIRSRMLTGGRATVRRRKASGCRDHAPPFWRNHRAPSNVLVCAGSEAWSTSSRRGKSEGTTTGPGSAPGVSAKPGKLRVTGRVSPVSGSRKGSRRSSSVSPVAGAAGSVAARNNGTGTRPSAAMASGRPNTDGSGAKSAPVAVRTLASSASAPTQTQPGLNPGHTKPDMAGRRGGLAVEAAARGPQGAALPGSFKFRAEKPGARRRRP